MQSYITPMYQHKSQSIRADVDKQQKTDFQCSLFFTLQEFKGDRKISRFRGSLVPDQNKDTQVYGDAQCCQPLSRRAMPSQGKANQSQSRDPTDPPLSLPGFLSKMSKAH